MGQFQSDLLGPTEVETWDTLMGAQDPSWNQPAPQPYVEPAADPMYAPAQELSYQQPYTAPEIGYGPDSPIYAPAEPAYGGPAEASYVDPFVTGDSTQQYVDPFMQQAYAPAPELGYAPTYEDIGIDPSMGQQFGWDQGTVAPAPEPDPFFNNPQFAESNAQFDYTTNPQNREGVGILGGLENLAGAYGADIPGWSDFARNTVIPTLAASQGAQNPLTWFDNPVGDFLEKGNKAGAEAFVPVSLGDVALTALPGVGLFDDAGKTALRGYGQNFDTLGKVAGKIDELPLEAARGALTRASENPAFAPDVAELVARRSVGPTLGGAADDASKFLDEVIQSNPGRIANDIAAMRAQNIPDNTIVDFLSQQTNDIGKAARAIGQQADEAPQLPLGNIDDLKSQLRQDLGIADQPKLDPAPGEKFPTGTVRSAVDDPVDVAEREFARVTDYGPAPIYGEQAALPLNLGAADDTRGFWSKFVDEAAAAASLPRSVLASFDLSAPGRQGLALAFRHPKEWVGSWVPMIKTWRTEGGAEAMARELSSINARVKSMVGTQDDLIHLYEVGADAKGLNKVPGFEGIGKGKIAGAIGKVDDALGNPLGRSERAYATFLNYQKSKTFETMATAMHQAGERNLDAYKRLGEVIDHATGFGAAPLTGRLEGQAFFSQRYMTSRFQFLTDPIVEALIKRDMNAARAATENLVAFTGGLGGILALVDATGTANVEWDPRSTDFGKIRIGPQRIDFGAGFLPLIRTLSREVTGEAKASTGAVYDTSRIKEPLKFLRNKLAPIPSEAISRILGEDPVGNPNPPILSFNTLANMFAPLIAQSTVEAFKQTGSPVAAGRAAVSELFGGGTSTYGVGQAQQIELAQNVYGKEYDSLASTQQASLNAYIVEQGGDLPYRNRQAPWWQARDDALTDWAASIDPKTLEDPFSQKALSIKDSGYVDLQPELVKWAEDTYSLPRDEAEAAVEKFLTSTGLDDQVKKYREYVLEQDPGFAKSWLDAYNNYEKDVYEPPKWIKDIAKGK